MTGKIKVHFWDNKLISALRQHKKPIERYWAHDNIYKATFFDATSIVIPVAENFVCDVAKRALLHIHDAKLKQQVEHLIEEENAHSAVHERYNAMLIQEGYDIRRYQKILERLCRFWKRYGSLQSQLAAAACIEHLTGMIGILGLEHGIFEGDLDERMRKVWIWHLLEEVDHHAATFDLYTHLGGGYLRRAAMMLGVLFVTFINHPRMHAGLLKQSGHQWDRKTLRDGMHFLWGKNGFYKNGILPALKFFHPSFHPSHMHIRDSLGYRVHRYRIEEELESYFPKN